MLQWSEMGAWHMVCALFLLRQGWQPLALAAVTGCFPPPFMSCLLLIESATMDVTQLPSCLFSLCFSLSCFVVDTWSLQWHKGHHCSGWTLWLLQVAKPCEWQSTLSCNWQLRTCICVWCSPTKQQGRNVQATFEHSTFYGELMLHACRGEHGCFMDKYIIKTGFSWVVKWRLCHAELCSMSRVMLFLQNSVFDEDRQSGCL